MLFYAIYQAQVAANQKGIQLMGELIESYSLRVVQSYMAHVQHSAELAVRDLLRRVSATLPSEANGKLQAEDQMDDGSRICLTVQLNKERGSAVFDFT
jgi:5-oxoprolinase (ATP-hydrolysing)